MGILKMRIMPLMSAVIAPLVGNRHCRHMATATDRQIFILSAIAVGAVHRQSIFSINVII